MVKHRLQIIGTDTAVGKTQVTLAMMAAIKQLEATVLASKPVATGWRSARLVENEDAVELRSTASSLIPYSEVNPCCLKDPLSPNISANKAGVSLSAIELQQSFRPFLSRKADILLIEGCGGWFCPISNNETMADFHKRLGFPLILVVGLRLGCLNHALLTLSAIKKSGLPCMGWVANVIDPEMLAIEENIETLQQFFGVPPLAVLQYQNRSLQKYAQQQLAPFAQHILEPVEV
jgi:dethiobiotin synthetase